MDAESPRFAAESRSVWTLEKLPRLLPGSSVFYTHLRDGRRVQLDDLDISLSTAGWGAGSLDTIWDNVVHRNGEYRTWFMGHESPTYLIPPVSADPDRRVLPRWRIRAELKSEPLAAHGEQSGYSALVVVFFCDAIDHQPVTALIGDHIAMLDEDTWRAYARNFEYF